MLVDDTVREFSDELASASPAPGGGSVAALCGNLAAALASMAARLTIGKEKYASADEEMKSLLMESEELRSQLLVLVDEDTAAFNQVMSALKLPKGAERNEALESAFIAAASVPLQTARLCLRAMELADAAAERGNQSSMTDATTAAIVAHAGLQSALLNVRVNLPSITDEGFVASAKEEASSLERDAGFLIEKVIKSAKAKL